jgi:folate-binding protein YgfZ
MASNDLQQPLEPFSRLLDHRRVLAIDGVDATAFLQAQLTADVAAIPDQEWRPAGYCSAKGRLLASGLLWRSESGWRWLIADDIAVALVKRLRMFVLRLKVTIEVMDTAVVGQVGSQIGEHQVAASAEGPVSTWLGLGRTLAQSRAFGLVDSQHLDRFLASPESTQAQAKQIWDWLEVRSGLSFIELATQDKFVPQMVNLEALGGVDFKKGCYPGQEVVARSQYLGKLKRRTLLAHAPGQSQLASVGGDVYRAQSMEPVGTVVSRASNPGGGLDCLIEAPLAAWSEGLSLTDSLDGRLEPLAMPYLLPDNDVFVRPRL